jgi:segregation and condensation protein B
MTTNRSRRLGARRTAMSDDVFTEAERARLRALVEAAIFVSPEPVPLKQLARATGQPPDVIQELLDSLAAEFDRPDHGLRVRALAGGYQISTKPEHHEGLKALLANLRPPLPLSRQAIETAAVIAMLQPVTAREIQTARRVRNNNAIRTLLRRKLIAPAGRAHTRGTPVQYRTTQQFLIEFGLNDLSELQNIEEFRHAPGVRAAGDSA